MDQLTVILAQPFKQHAKRELPVETFSFTLSLTIGWLTPPQVKEVILMGVESGLVTIDKAFIKAVFDPKRVEVHQNFKFDFNALKPYGIRELAKQRITRVGVDPDSLDEKIEDVRRRYAGLLDDDVATLVASSEMGADIEDIAKKIESRIRKNEKT